MDPAELENSSYGDLMNMAKDLGLIHKGKIRKKALVKMLRKSMAPPSFKAAASSCPTNTPPQDSSTQESELLPEHNAETHNDDSLENVDPGIMPLIPDPTKSSPSKKICKTLTVASTPLRTPPLKPGLKVKPTPNFARIHERAFSKMESIDSYVARRGKAAAKLESRIPRRVDPKAARRMFPRTQKPETEPNRKADASSATVASGIKQRNRLILGKVRSNRRYDLLLSHRGIDV